MQFFAWLIFGLTHFTFGPQKRERTGSARRATSGRAALLESYTLLISKYVIQGNCFKETISVCEGAVLSLKIWPLSLCHPALLRHRLLPRHPVHPPPTWRCGPPPPPPPPPPPLHSRQLYGNPTLTHHHLTPPSPPPLRRLNPPPPLRSHPLPPIASIPKPQLATLEAKRSPVVW